jgi:hypothetical protein
LVAVFTEKTSENGQMERFVYVQQGEGFEKRNVKVGVADYFYAEIQEGLKEGEIVSLELPKEERDKKGKEVAAQRKSGGEAAGPGAKTAVASSGTRTNLNAASGSSAPGGSSGERSGKKRGPGSGLTRTSP